MDDREKEPRETAGVVDSTPEVKLDKRGLPLIPQPSDQKDDPLVCSSTRLQIPFFPFAVSVPLTRLTQNWPIARKLSVLLQISFLALLGPMSAAVINPAFVPLGEAFDITTVEASYELTVYVRETRAANPPGSC